MMHIKQRLIFLCLTLISAVFIFSAIYCNPKLTESEEYSYLNHNDSVNYIGMDACKACHYTQYESFLKTGMGQSFAEASHEKSAAKFSDHDVIYDPHLNFYYKPFFQNNNFYIMEYRLDANKDTIHKYVEKVDYIIGSGQHTNSHMYEENGYFFQMPLTFYTQKGKWDLPPGFEAGNNSRFSRAIELECMSCHNAYPNFIEGSKNKFASVPQGIDCERCHGPGALHAKEKALGNLVDTATHIDYTIVNPKKLSYDLQVDVCQRCHLQGNAVLKEGKTFFDFRPGEKLSDYMNIFLPRYEGNNEAFIMASHADRLKMSACFIQSNKQNIHTEHRTYVNSKVKNKNVSSLTCISCHNPHISIKYTEDEQYNTTCKSCHGSKELPQLPLCTETMNNRKVHNDNCWKCHMPKTGTIDIPHVSVHDHRIQIPIRKEDKEELKKFIGLAAINNPNPDKNTIGEAYLSYFEKFDNQLAYLDSANIYLSKQEEFSPRHFFNNKIRLYFLQQNYTALIQTANSQTLDFAKDAWTYYRIGEAYLSTKNLIKAAEYFRLATAKAPLQLDFLIKQAGVENSLGNTSKAQEIYEFVLKENTKYTIALSNLGYIYLSQNRIEDALSLLDKAISINPDYEQALLNKAALLVYTNQKSEALIYLKRILKINPNNAQALAAVKRINEL